MVPLRYPIGSGSSLLTVLPHHVVGAAAPGAASDRERAAAGGRAGALPCPECAPAARSVTARQKAMATEPAAAGRKRMPVALPVVRTYRERLVCSR